LGRRFLGRLIIESEHGARSLACHRPRGGFRIGLEDGLRAVERTSRDSTAGEGTAAEPVGPLAVMVDHDRRAQVD
jgi:hypothetical protein